MSISLSYYKIRSGVHLHNTQKGKDETGEIKQLKSKTEQKIKKVDEEEIH